MKKTHEWQQVESVLSSRAQGNWNIAHLVLDSQQDKNRIALTAVDKDLSPTNYTFEDLIVSSNIFASVLVSLGVIPEDRVLLYLPRIAEQYFAFYGVLKAKAVAVPVFSAFEHNAVVDRLIDSGAKVLITHSSLLPRILSSIDNIESLKYVLVVDSEHENHPKCISYLKFSIMVNQEFTCLQTQLDDSAFMLYTSGSTGKPKGVLHAHKTILQQYYTGEAVFNFKKDDILWCTADPGWITGVSYTLITPLAHGVRSIFYSEGFDAEKWYSILEKFLVTKLYTAPTGIRLLMASPIDPKNYNLSSLQLVASVGEPLNSEAIVWGQKKLGLTILDTWYQTELGSICITNSSKTLVKPGSMGKPLPGIYAAIIDEKGVELPANELGNLALKQTFPSFMKTIWNNKEKYDSYFLQDWYLTGDVAYKDADGYFWFSGRNDDLINTAGERVGPFEVESALLLHDAVVEAAVIGKPDSLRGEIIKAFIVLKDYEGGEDLIKELQEIVKANLGYHTYPREIDFVTSLPKTRSGKIMRRVLRARELGQEIGDTSAMDKE